MTAPLVEVKDLAKTFDVSAPWLNRVVERKPRQFVHAVDGVSFAIQRGKTLALVGESGCGKSTVARLLVGLYRPTRGSVQFDGKDTHGTADQAQLRVMRRRMQMIFQDPYASLNPRWKVQAIVGEPLTEHGLVTDAGELRDKVAELLRSVGLAAADVEKFPHQFSGGQRQRISIARALATQPEFLVCDEPTSALDVSVQAQVLNIMKDLQRQRGLTYLFISHNLAVVRHVSYQAQRALQVFHEVEHLRLHAHVQRRGRLVADQELGLGRQRAGDRNALALAARELVRVLDAVLRREADRLQQCFDPVPQVGLVRDHAVFGQRLGHDVLDDPARVQARVRVLEDHLDAAAQLAALGRLERGMGILAVEGEATPRGRVQTHQQACHGALAATRLADQRQRLAPGDVEAHAIDRLQQQPRRTLDHPVEPGRRHVEGHRQVTRLDQRCGHVAVRLGCASCRSGRTDRCPGGVFAMGRLPACGGTTGLPDRKASVACDWPSRRPLAPAGPASQSVLLAGRVVMICLRPKAQHAASRRRAWRRRRAGPGARSGSGPWCWCSAG